MAILYATGFEHGDDTITYMDGWRNIGAANWISAVQVHSMRGIGGSYSLYLDDYLYSPFVPETSRWVNFWFKPNNPGVSVMVIDFCYLTQSADQVTVEIAANGTVTIKRSVTVLATSVTQIDMTEGHWLSINAVCDNVVGLVYVYVDNSLVPIVSFNGDTQYRSVPGWDHLMWGVNQGVFIDDFIVSDAATGRVNEVVSKVMVPSSDIAVAMTPSAGPDNYAMVDEIAPVSTVDYNYCAAGAEDTYGMTTSGINKARSVLCTKLYGYACKDGNLTQAELKIVSGVTTDYAPITRIGGTGIFEVISNIWETNPDTGLDWMIQEVNSVQTGMRVSV